MKDKKQIAVLLPNKEDYSLNNAAAASIWVRDFNKGKIINKQIIYGIATQTPLSKISILSLIVFDPLKVFGSL